jgi:tetratricopeptide (TPR) repeat protein
MWSSLIPTGFVAWRERRKALRELDGMRQQEENTLALDDANLVNRAKIALSLGDRVEALAFWQVAVLRYPHFAHASPDAVRILIGLGLFDDAESLLLERQRREPSVSDHWRDYALVAERRGNLEEAVRRWADVRRKFSGEWMGYVNGAVCLRKTGQIEAAEALHQESFHWFGTQLEAWLEWARTAESQRDWPEALRRWEAMDAKFKHINGYLGIAKALEALGRIPEAEDCLQRVQMRYPLVHEIPVALARLAELRGDNDAAERQWAETQRRFPLLQQGYRGRSRLLKEMGRYADAEAVLIAARDRFPAEPWPETEYATLDQLRKNWAAAAERWATVRARWPERKDGYGGGIQALAALGRKDEAARLSEEFKRRFPA